MLFKAILICNFLHLLSVLFSSRDRKDPASFELYFPRLLKPPAQPRIYGTGLCSPSQGRYVALDQKSQKRTQKGVKKGKLLKKGLKIGRKKYSKKENVPQKVLNKGSSLKKELKKVILLKRKRLKKSEFTQNMLKK